MITQKQLKELLHYEPLSGHFTWLKTYNSRTIKGTRAGGETTARTKPRLLKYRRIQLHKKCYKEHRLAWLYMTGKWPQYGIDHIDRNSINNAWLNLRDVPQSVNTKNASIASNNTSGTTGVFKNNGRGTNWGARICVSYKQVHLGYFDTKKEAIDARKQAETRYGFI